MLPVDARAFRDALGRFATGVTVVTAVHEGQIRGMTANAFTAVSLEPPLVLVSVAHKARMHEHLARVGSYGVSVLSEDQEALALHFAGRQHERMEVGFIWRRELPLLAGALAHLACTVEAVYPGGDHTLFLGRVEDLWFRDGSPLTFYRGRFYGLIRRATEAPPAPATLHDLEEAGIEDPGDPWW